MNDQNIVAMMRNKLFDNSYEYNIISEQWFTATIHHFLLCVMGEFCSTGILPCHYYNKMVVFQESVGSRYFQEA